MDGSNIPILNTPRENITLMLFAQLQKGGSANMQKAKYMERQPEVRWQPVNNGMVDVTLCLIEKKVTIEQGQMEYSAKQMM